MLRFLHRPGEFICQFSGEAIRRDEPKDMRKVRSLAKSRMIPVDDLEKGVVLHQTNYCSVSHFFLTTGAQHSDLANVEAVPVLADMQPWPMICFFARRFIHPGEPFIYDPELTRLRFAKNWARIFARDAASALERFPNLLKDKYPRILPCRDLDYRPREDRSDAAQAGSPTQEIGSSAARSATSPASSAVVTNGHHRPESGSGAAVVPHAVTVTTESADGSQCVTESNNPTEPVASSNAEPEEGPLAVTLEDGVPMRQVGTDPSAPTSSSAARPNDEDDVIVLD